MGPQSNIEQGSQAMGAPIVNSLEGNSASLFTRKLIVILLAVAVLGVGTGYLLSKKGAIINSNTQTSKSSSSVKAVVGSTDTKTFKDTAEGIVKIGGIDGEGAFHLLRPGGQSQNVYMTSSIVDLSSFVDKKVKVWGETQKAKRAGWLMDVGRVEVLQ